MKSCSYNHDTGAIDIIYVDGTTMNILCNVIEDTLDLTPAMKSKYDWLIFNEPTTFAELALTGELQTYLERYAKSCNKQESNIRKQLEKQYSPETAREIAREFMMYSN